MTKKLLAISLVLLMLVPAVFAKSDGKKLVPMDNKTQILVPGTARQIPANLLEVRTVKNNSDDLEIVRIKPSAGIKGMDELNALNDQLWPIKHVDDNAEYYLGSGAANDTFATVFTPAAPAIVQEVWHQWFTPGNLNAFGASYNPALAATYPSGQSQDASRADNDGAGWPRPIGEFKTTITPNTIDAYDDSWSTQLDIGGTFIVGDSTDLSNVPPFVIGWVKGGDDPKPLADATDDQGDISYTWFSGPWTEGAWGRYSGAVDLMMLVKVTYPWGAPISIQSMSQVNNTYDLAGPFTVEVDLLDDVKDGAAIDGNDVLNYNWAVNGGTANTGSLTASDVGADGNGIYTFDIAGTFAAGDVIEYWVDMVDNDNLPSESVHLMFEIKEPSNPSADLLIVYDGTNEEQQAAMLYEMAAAKLGIVFEMWNVSAEQGIDASVINAGWGNIVVYGWGTRIVPAVAGEWDPGFADFLDAGGNLLLADQDWYYGHGLPADITFAAGDFAYDYFGIGSGTNDPADDAGVSIADTAFYGVGGTPMDLPFAAAPMVIDHGIYATTNWGDPVIPSTATGIFSGANDGLSYGVAYASGTFNTAYFGFMPDAAVDTAADGSMTSDQFDAFFTGALDWMGVSSPPLVTEVSSFATSTDASARTVSATIADFDGEAITAKLMYTLDEGANWVEAAMTASGDVFSADIPALTAEGWIAYYIVAEDASGAVTMYPDANSPSMAFYYLMPVEDILYVDATDGYIGYFAGHHFGAFGAMDVYDFYEYGWPDASVFNVNNYSTIVWNAEYENGWFWPGTAGHELEAFVAAGGNVVLTGDEALAYGYGWPGPINFGAGDAMHDFFGLSGAWSDAYNFKNWMKGVAGTATDGVGNLPYATPYGLSDWRDQAVIGDFMISGGSGADPSGTGTRDTLRIVQSAWYGTAYNSGTHKAVFMPIYMGGLGPNAAAVGSGILAYFDDAAAPVGVEGIIGPELGDILQITTDRDNAQLVTEFALNDAYPNPFNPTTNISFEVPHASDVVVSVYNMLGQKVVELANSTYSQGIYNVTWNGLDANGNAVGSGLYIYHMDAGEFSATNKMLYLK